MYIHTYIYTHINSRVYPSQHLWYSVDPAGCAGGLRFRRPGAAAGGSCGGGGAAALRPGAGRRARKTMERYKNSIDSKNVDSMIL